MIVDGLLQKGDLGCLYGAPSAGKSLLALDLALRLATRERDWCSRELKHGPAVFIAAEGSGGLRRRIGAWGTTSDDPKDPGRWAELPGRFVAIQDGVPMLSDPRDVSLLIEQLCGLEEIPILVVVDSLRMCMRGDENKSADVAAVADGCHRIKEDVGCAVVLIHHSRADGVRERGSTALRAACDMMAKVSNKDGVISMKPDKVREGELPQPPLRFTLRQVLVYDSDGENPVTSVKPMPVSLSVKGPNPNQPAPPAEPARETFPLTVYLDAVAPFDDYGADRKAICEATGMSRETYQKRRREAFEKGYIKLVPGSRPTRYCTAITAALIQTS